MDYEEKYKIALERATQSWECGDMTREHLEYLFPELAEPEDEKIRKVLIGYFKSYREVGTCGAETFNGISTDNIIAWLEKQEKKPQGKSALEAIHEQNPDNANKVERKFKVGDWITDGKALLYITKFEENYGYELKAIDGKVFHFVSPDLVEANYHLWTIADVKEGDILTFDNNVCIMGTIICKSPTSYDTKSYCRLIDEHFIGEEESGWDSRLLVPATKEQCDLFFQKMKEAGCRWNPTEKKLEKIECGKESESKKEEKSYNTEECNCIIQDTISICEQARKKATNEIDYENVTRCIDWLKSLEKK